MGAPKRQHRLWLVATAVLLTGAFAARADVGPPVTVRLLGDPRAARAGEPFAGVLEITPGVTAKLGGFRLEGEGWSVTRLDATAEFLADKDTRVELPFTAVPKDADTPLEFVLDLGGQSVRVPIDLSPASVQRATQPQPMRILDDAAPRRVDPLPDRGDKSSNILVTGRWAFHRHDGAIVGADGCEAQVWHQNPGGTDVQLGAAYTDSLGYYRVTFTWWNTWLPDLYVCIRSADERAMLCDPTWKRAYTWNSPVQLDFAGTVLDFGTNGPRDTSQDIGLSALTNVKRTWRWFFDKHGYVTPSVSVVWPESVWPHWWDDAIHIGSSGWSEATCTHEFGHHWMNAFGRIPDYSYCNEGGYCDDSSCGHCIWCRESQAVAWLEGFPIWLSDIIPRTFAADYGLAAAYASNMEPLKTCEPGEYHAATVTEGFLAAMLRDMADDEQDAHGLYGAVADAMSGAAGEILAVAALDKPLGSVDFVADFRARFPAYGPELWQTMKNSGYDIDVSRPSGATNLRSTSHLTTGSSADPTIDFAWTTATDDFSGVAGYAVHLGASPAQPAETLTMGNVTSWTSPALAPGVWYLCLRTLDVAGRWQEDYVTCGPFTLRAAEPANLTAYQPAGWSHTLVPRAAADASAGSAPEPTYLFGYANQTYASFAGQNVGGAATSGGHAGRLLADGVPLQDIGFGACAAGAPYLALNRGPFTIKGGRHTLEIVHDGLEQIAETNETDNGWARQWVWSPRALAANTVVTETAPPLRTASWASIVDGSLKQVNVDGYRFSGTGWWNAVVVRPLNPAADYDLNLYAPTSGAASGFASPLASSGALGGYLDAVIVNRNQLGVVDSDVGVLNWGNNTDAYELVQVTSEGTYLGSAETVTLTAGRMLFMREFSPASSDTGWITMTVDGNPADGPIHARWLDYTFTRGGLYDASASAVSDASGRARINAHIGNSGWHCLVVYRDPRDGVAARTVTILVQRTTPDLLPNKPAGWHSPLVPRPAADGTATIVALPDTLYGNLGLANLNLAVRNASVVGAPAMNSRVYLDGVLHWSPTWGALAANGAAVLNSGVAPGYRGGRHTLSVRYDDPALITELDETNNVYGEQYVWGPLGLTWNTSVVRSTPPAATGGWADLRSGESVYANCDGLRLPIGSGWWRAVAITPGDTSDVDLRLHEIAAGAKAGFADCPAASLWGRGATDYVLVNFNLTATRAFDVGAVNYAGTQGYTVEAVQSSNYGFDGSYLGAVTELPANRMLDLAEFWLPAGLLTVRLENAAGTVDWGVTVHPLSPVCQGKSDALPNGIAWNRGAGLDELVTVDIATAGWHVVAVWKVGAVDLPKVGSYRLHLSSGVSGVPGDTVPGAVTAFNSIHPNPFNPTTRIEFELARPGLVQLEVFDLLGARVRRLVDAALPAGRHEAIWDGCDDDGRALASGAYVARLAAGEVRLLRKMTLIK